MFLFNHTIPVILKNEVNNTKLIISLVLSPGVLMLSKGGTLFIYSSPWRL